jgi:hypothetical protein
MADDKKIEPEKAPLEKREMPLTPAGKNPFENYGDQADSNWLGDLLKFNKGDYVVGRDADECSHTELVAIMPGLVHGMLRWEDGRPIHSEMGLMMDGFVLPARNTLDCQDKSLWEVDDKGKPIDPWHECFYLPVISVNAEDVYTFATDSDGGRRHGIRPLCADYGNHIRQHPDEVPVIGLEQGSYLHSNPSVGRVKYPVFPTKRYVKVGPYLAAIEALTGRTFKLPLLPPAAAA